MTNQHPENSAPRFTALKGRLGVEAFLRRKDRHLEVDERSLLVPTDSGRYRLQFKEAEGGFLELTLVAGNSSSALPDFEDALMQTPAPPETTVQILCSSEVGPPVFVAKRRFAAPLDAWEAVRWCAACEEMLPQRGLSRPFSETVQLEHRLEEEAKEENEAEDPNDSSTLAALACTQDAMLDFLLERFGDRVRVSAAMDLRAAIVGHAVPFGDAWFQFVVCPGSAQTCRLNISVLVGRLFSRQTYAVKWLLRNCVGKLLTFRPSSGRAKGRDLQLGCQCIVPAGPSAALVENIECVLNEGWNITSGLRLWFPNLIDGDVVGTVLLHADDPNLGMPLLAVSDPEALVEHFKPIFSTEKLGDLPIDLAFEAALWSGSYTTAIAWADQYEAALVNLPRPEDQVAQLKWDKNLHIILKGRIRALCALGRDEEALAAYTEWTAEESEHDTQMKLARASLLIRLRRIEEAEHIVKQLDCAAGLRGILTQTLVSAGLGRRDEAETGLELYQNIFGEDIAAQALFRELTVYFEENSSNAKTDNVDWFLDKIEHPPADEEKSSP
jgi:tetratricopeptide (TPR) repeat protein